MATCTSKLKQLGIELGASPYSTATTAFTRGLLVSDFDCNPAQGVEPVGEVRGRLDTIRTTKGLIEYKAKMTFPLDAGDATSAGIGDFLASIYGAEVGSIVAAKYLHVFSLGQVCDPSYLNIWSDKDATPKQYTGFRPGSLKISVNAKEGQIPVEVDGILQTEASKAAQTLVFSAADLMVPSMATVLTLGAAVISDLESVEITIERGQEGIATLGTSRNIGRLVSGKTFSIKLACTGIAFATETERAKFLANTVSAFNLKLLDTDGMYIDFNFPEITYQTFDGPSIKGEDILRVNLAAIVTGTTHHIDLQNLYTKKYTDGTVIV